MHLVIMDVVNVVAIAGPFWFAVGGGNPKYGLCKNIIAPREGELRCLYYNAKLQITNILSEPI